ncbi:MAG: hypothetical protein ACLFV8_09650, partial [Alphaproteobacteria bacterium]
QALFRKGEDRYGQASVLGNLGAVALDRGEFAQSADLLVRALTIFEEMGAENAEVAQFERWRGQALEGQGQTAGACAAWRRSQNLYRRLGSEGQARNVEELMTKAGCPGE